MEAARRIPKDIDWVMLGSMLTISLVGVAFIHSAKMTQVGLAPEAMRQLIALALAIVALLVILKIDYRRLLSLAPYVYAAGILGLLAVFPFGIEVGGNKAWLHIGSLSIQPSEPMKVATVLMLASIISHREGFRLRDTMMQALVVGLPMGIISFQDQGTALTFVPLMVATVFVSGLRWRWILAAVLAGALLAPLGWSLLKPYQKTRIEIFVHPELDPKGVGYHAIQSRIAVGSGGLLGQGYLKGPQNRLGFLPERHTDYIFAVVAEEWGFVRAAAVLGLFLLLIKRLIDAAVLARDRQGAILCVGAVTFISIHLMINVGMVLGLMPTIGIPLPFMSFGGSSLIAFISLVALGVNVRMRRLAG